MRIFLIRHGETVDNVANLYAGIRDSALTVHGSLQAQRLAKYLTESGLRFTHVFSSDLQRAQKTAFAICLTQSEKNEDGDETAVKVTALSVLREQDFGIYEGKSFSARYDDSKKSANTSNRSEGQRQDDGGVESKESMGTRAKAFIDEQFVPAIQPTIEDDTSAIAVVSHGIFLGHIWRALLRLLPQNSVTLSPGLTVGGGGGGTALEYLGGWSNTGYLELILQKAEAASIDRCQSDGVDQTNLSSRPPSTQHGEAISPQDSLAHIKVTIKTINGRGHLTSLKRTRGGVGSSKLDEGQKSIESFFKKRKCDEVRSKSND